MRVSSPDDLLRFSPRIAVSVQKGKRPPVTRSALFFFLVPGQLPPGPAALVPFRGQAHPFYNIPKKLQYFPRYPTPPTPSFLPFPFPSVVKGSQNAPS